MKRIILALLVLVQPALALTAGPDAKGNEISQARNKGQRGEQMRSEKADVPAKNRRRLTEESAPPRPRRLQKLSLSNVDFPKHRGRR